MEEDFQQPSEAEMELNRSLPMAATQDANLTMWQLDSSEILEGAEHRLRGEIFGQVVDKDGNIRRAWYCPVGSRPLMNELGIRQIINLSSNNIDRITFLSNLSEEQILMMTKETHKDLAQLISRNHRLYELDKSNFNIVISMIVFRIFPALMRAWQEWERKHLRTVERRGYTYSGDSEQKKGLSFNPFAKRDK